MTDPHLSTNAADAAAPRHPMLELLESVDEQREFHRGDMVRGTVVLVTGHEVLIDIGAKYEGILSSREMNDMSPDQRQDLSVGSTVECMVVNPHDRDGNLVLSLSQAQVGQDWDEAERLFDTGDSFEEIVSGHNKGGLIVHVGRVRGFIPASQIDRRHAIDRSMIDGGSDSPLARFVGHPISVKIIEIDRRKNRLILSEQAAMRERRKQRKADLLDTLQEGLEVEGIVTSLADFGAFVDIGGADGLVHLSELSWQRVTHPKEVVDLGQRLKVKVISVDRERKRIGLSLKQLEPEPWGGLEGRYQVGEVVQAEITRLTEFGAFAKLADDVEGLIHVSELSDDGRPAEEVIQPGDKVELRVIRIEADRKRLGLSLKRSDPSYDGLSDETLAAGASAQAEAAGAPMEAEAEPDEAEAEPVEAEAEPVEAEAEPVEAEAEPVEASNEPEPEQAAVSADALEETGEG